MYISVFYCIHVRALCVSFQLVFVFVYVCDCLICIHMCLNDPRVVRSTFTGLVSLNTRYSLFIGIDY